jgi:hypothetical protein
VRSVIEQRDVTTLSDRDRHRFMALLDDALPNAALVKAANRYKKKPGASSSPRTGPGAVARPCGGEKLIWSAPRFLVQG